MIAERPAIQVEYLTRTAEKRTFTRRKIDLPVALSHFHIGCPYGPLEARTCDQSVSGLCIDSPWELPKQMVVFMRALKHDPKAMHSEQLLKSAAVGEVRWCRRMAYRDGQRYLAGIRYF